MKGALETLYYRKYRISFVVTQPFVLESYPYHLTRGVFGKIVHDEVCLNPSLKNCDSCNETAKCPFTQIFEVMLPPSHPLYGKYTKPPVPYIIYPDLGGRSKFAGRDLYNIELTLVGKAIEYDTFLLQSVQRISEGKGILYKKLECTGIETMVGDDKRSHLRFDIKTQPASHLKLRFNTPLILKIKDKPAVNLPFEVLTERLNERIALFCYLYCDGNLPDLKSFRKQIDTEGYIDSFYPVEVEISDGGRKQTPPKEGILGSVAYRGNIGDYLPVIRAGEVLHLGSYPNYGLGKYTIDETYSG